jgi:hypothetical protein
MPLTLTGQGDCQFNLHRLAEETTYSALALHACTFLSWRSVLLEQFNTVFSFYSSERNDELFILGSLPWPITRNWHLILIPDDLKKFFSSFCIQEMEILERSQSIETLTFCFKLLYDIWNILLKVKTLELRYSYLLQEPAAWGFHSAVLSILVLFRSPHACPNSWNFS